MNKRHAKPTTRQLLERIYRRQIENDKRLREHAKVLADHCNRLLREKETLMRMLNVSDLDRQSLRPRVQADGTPWNESPGAVNFVKV